MTEQTPEEVGAYLLKRLDQIDAHLAARYPKAAKDGQLASMLSTIRDEATMLAEPEQAPVLEFPGLNAGQAQVKLTELGFSGRDADDMKAGARRMVLGGPARGLTTEYAVELTHNHGRYSVSLSPREQEGPVPDFRTGCRYWVAFRKDDGSERAFIEMFLGLRYVSLGGKSVPALKFTDLAAPDAGEDRPGEQYLTPESILRAEVRP